MQNIIILGAGPAGMALGMKLISRSDLHAEVVIIEKESYVGGMASSFEYEGLYFDYGSHRLHRMTTPEILHDIRSILGPDLLDRPRNGRIRLLRRFVKFPLKPLDIALRLPPSFLGGIARDMITKPFKQRNRYHTSFSDVLLDGLGETVCKKFYFPYARKLWGLPPEKIGAIQAHRRISAKSIGKMIRKVLGVIPGLKTIGGGHFYYPRKGIGQICQAMLHEFERKGGKVLLSTAIQGIFLENAQKIKILTVPSQVSQEVKDSDTDSVSKTHMADMVFSTIPINNLINSLRPEPPKDVIKASNNLRYRGMILCYLILKADHFTPYDAHYFPEDDVIFSRLSEPKNYSRAVEPQGATGLCAEIPCWVGDNIWNASEDEISRTVINDLARSDLSVKSPVKAAFTRRLSQAYPVYDLKYGQRFQVVERYCSQIPGIVSLGRQGLFVHDNIHHSFEMAYAASKCLKSDGSWNSEIWQNHRERFKTFIVED